MSTLTEWLAFGYLGVVSMFLGFFAWYRGLAIGPMAQVSQVQLVQPMLSILWAALILHEHVGWPSILGGLVIIVCAALAARTRRRAEPAAPEPRAQHGRREGVETSTRRPPERPGKYTRDDHDAK